MRARDFCLGAAGGALLSISRPPAGMTLAEWMAPSGERQALWRALALIVFGAALIARRPNEGERPPALQVALGAAAGFALHGLLLVDVVPFDSTLAWGAAMFAGALTLLWLGARGTDAPGVAPLLQRIALLACGGGLATALAALDSRSALLGGGTRDDATIFGAAFLALAALGALAFGPLLARRALPTPWFALCVAAAACLALPSFEFLRGLALPRAYTEVLERFHLNSDGRGTLAYDAWLAARVFGLPALAVGLALASRGGVANAGWALVGAALASVAAQHWTAGFDAATVETVAVQASERAAVGALAAAAGALLAALVNAGSPPKLRAGYALAAAFLLAAAWRWQPASALPLSPWERVDPRVEWIRETPEGLLTVELQGGRGRIATLDRRRLTQTRDEEPAEELRWRALELPPGAEVVLAGLLTPERAVWISLHGARAVHVETAWPGLERELQAALLAGAPAPEGLAVGWDSSWRERAESASVVIAATPAEAAARTLALRDVPEGARLVAWLPAHQDVAQLDWGQSVIATCAHIDDFCIGAVRGFEGGRMSAGPRARWRFAQVLRPVPEREQSARVRAALRLAHGEGTPAARALLLICRAQVQSSPFGSRAQRTELDDGALALLRESALRAEPRHFERELDEFAAGVLEGRRDLDGLGAFAAPVADAHPGWARMQRAAARGDWEFLDFAAAAARLERVVEATPYDLQARSWLAEALLRAGEPARALAAAEALLAIQPDRPDAVRLRALAAARAGDPRARAWIETWLAAHAKDVEVAMHAGPGPFPDLAPPLGIPGEFPATEEH